eukprot:525574-Pleurochrysis_carterae.AAC.1
MVRCCFVASADSTSTGRSSLAGACVAWKVVGTPSGKYVWTRLSMSETGPSSSTYQRCARAVVNVS